MENKTNFFSLKTAAKKMKTEDPCWKGYKMIGTKKGKGGKDVPNCVPIDSKKSSSEIRTAEKKMKGEDPCWEGYEMIGTKPGKGGREVPNCVPKKKKKASSIFDLKTAQTFEDWANHELEEEHHQDSMDDGVLTFDEWVNDELSEPDHAAMGQGFSFDDWAREEENEIDHMHDEDYDEDEYGMEDYEDDEDYEMEDFEDGDEYDFDDEEDHNDEMMDDWHEECHECEYEKHGEEPMHGECHECEADDLMNDWHDHMQPHMLLLSSDKNRTITAKKSPAWQRSEGKNKEGGLNEKGRKSYNRETGGHLKAPVTEKKPKGKRKKRRKSFCARMKGMKKKLTSKKTARDPNSRINKALRKWNC